MNEEPLCLLQNQAALGEILVSDTVKSLLTNLPRYADQVDSDVAQCDVHSEKKDRVDQVRQKAISDRTAAAALSKELKILKSITFLVDNDFLYRLL